MAIFNKNGSIRLYSAIKPTSQPNGEVNAIIITYTRLSIRARSFMSKYVTSSESLRGITKTKPNASINITASKNP